MEIENFRQFYGKQSIDFSMGNKNVTIIFGENGKGKTGIFRALMFALFGNRYLAQDNKKDKIHLVNFIALEESSPATARVKVKFQNKSKTYTIERTIQGVNFNNEIMEREGEVKLFLIDEDGNISPQPIIDVEEIDRIINSILDEKIKDFFLFDAEKIDTLARTDSKVKEEVKTGIVKLLQIDKLEKSLSITNRLLSKENKRITEKSANIDLKNKELEIEQIEASIKAMEEKIDFKKENIISCNNEIESIREKLEENQDIRKIHEKIKELDTKKRYKTETLRTAKQGLKNSYFNSGHQLIMQDFYKDTNAYLNQVLIDQKDLIPIEVIEKSLEDMTCACCKSDLNKAKEALENILQLKTNYKRSELTPLITKINSSIYDFQASKKDTIDGTKRALKQIRELKDDIYLLEREINTLKDESKEFSQSEENLKVLEKSLSEKIKLFEELKLEVKLLEKEIEENQKEKNKLEREYDDLLRKNTETEYEVKRLDYIRELNERLKNLFEEYSDDMRDKLAEESTNIFKTLIDSKDKELVKNICINGKYELEVYGWNHNNITQDISQGQRQVLALSFITALAKVAAGGNKNIDFPLFMDTPFGRISGNNRDNLIDNIPDLTSQWILLLTDTEFSISEEIRFKGNNRLGKWYKLEQIKPGHSEIIEVNLSEQMATRR